MVKEKLEGVLKKQDVTSLRKSCLDPEIEADLLKNASSEEVVLIRDSHETFFADRVFFLPVARMVVKDIFGMFVPSGVQGVEFGAGSCGAFYNLLLPAEFKPGWRQYEIVPSLVGENRSFSKTLFGDDSYVAEGNIYDMPLKDESVDLIVGLSTWDSITHFGKAVSETLRCLKKGSVFIHFQDVFPTLPAVLVPEFLEREKRGLEPECLCYFCFGDDDEETPEEIGSILYDNKMIKSGRCLTDHLARAHTQQGFSVLLNREITRTRTLTLDKYFDILRSLVGDEFTELAKQGRGRVNSITYRVGNHESLEDPSLDGKIRLTYSADVLVAQK